MLWFAGCSTYTEAAWPPRKKKTRYESEFRASFMDQLPAPPGGGFYMVRELAIWYRVSPKTIRAWFRNEPDVLIVTAPGGKPSLRIPVQVAQRVHGRRIQGSGNNALQPASPGRNPGSIRLFGHRNGRVTKKPAHVVKTDTSEQLAYSEGVS